MTASPEPRDLRALAGEPGGLVDGDLYRRPDTRPLPLPAGREALTLPLLLLTVAGAGGVRVAADGALALVPPSLVALVLAVFLIAALVRSGALDPARLAGGWRTPLENASGVIVLLTLGVATAQMFTLLTPASGLFAFVFDAFFALLLWNTLAADPDRPRLLRSLGVVLGGAFVLKFVVLAALYDPHGGLLRRMLLAVLDGVAPGPAPPSEGPVTGYLAFVVLGLYFVALVLLPPRRRSFR
jgi:hypothetical protein